MYDPRFLDELCKEIAKRLAPLLNGKGNGGGNGGSGAPAMKRLLTVEEAKAYLGRKSNQSIYHLVNRRQIPAVRHGRHLRFDVRALDAWIESDKT